MTGRIRKPDFLIIGAQKAGTTWLWRMLDSHPGTTLPARKEPHFFGSSELYGAGMDVYWQNFAGIDNSQVTGEASTTYLSDKLAFFYNDINALEYDDALPSPASLVAEHLPDVKIIVTLRDPVSRAISAYHHFMRQGNLPVRRGLIRTIEEHPRLRILELGDYARHLAPWTNAIARENLLVLIFEDDIVRNTEETLGRVYGFLGLDPSFSPTDQAGKVNKRWTWTQTVASYYAGPLKFAVQRGPLAGLIQKYDWLKDAAITPADIAYLRDVYAPSKASVEALIGPRLSSWTYGANRVADNA